MAYIRINTIRSAEPHDELPTRYFQDRHFLKAYESAQMAVSSVLINPVLKTGFNKKKNVNVQRLTVLPQAEAKGSYFPWPPLEAGLPISTFCFLFTS